MKKQLFCEYIGNVFDPYLKRKAVKFPVLLFVNGHCTHLTYEISELCSKLQIILVALYPNSTRIMQPANVAVFKRLKEGWKKAVLNFRRENPDKVLTKEKFAPVLKTLVDNVKPETDQNDFRASGLYPWNPAAIDYSKCTVKNYKEQSNDENSRNVNVVTFKTFRKIVGEEKIEMFKNFSEDAIHTEDLLTLFHLYDEFSKTKTSKKAQVETMTEDLLNENFDLNGIIEHAVNWLCMIIFESSAPNPFQNNSILCTEGEKCMIFTRRA
jgi:hypothetical protein